MSATGTEHPTTHTAEPAPARGVAELVASALAEDAPWGDVSGEVSIPSAASARAELVSRADGVLAGTDCIVEAFRQADAAAEVTLHLRDGEHLTPEAPVATITGNAGDGA